MNRITRNKYNGKDRLKEKKEKKKLTKKQKIIIWSVIGAILAMIAIVIGNYIYKADGNIANAAINMMADAVGDETPLTALVMGVSTDLENDLTDTIILVGYNPKTQASFMLSIPRDTFVGSNENTAGGFDKINALYQKNVKKTVSAVEKLTGVNIDYYVVVKTEALIEVVDAIGGVEFNVPIDMKYDDPTQDLHIDLKKGVQVLDGDKAEQLLRYRHSNPDSKGKMSTYPASYGSDDFGRMRTQREFITATINQMVTWKNISKIKNIVSAVFGNLETNMSMGKMIGYIPSALKLDTSSIRAEQLPGESALINELWFYRQDTSKTKELVTELMDSLGLSEKEYNKKYTPIKAKSTNKKVDDEKIKAESSLTTNTNTNTNRAQTQETSSTTTAFNTTSMTNVTSTNNEIITSENCTHNWTLTINHEPTCGENGARVYTCVKCGEEKSEVIPATGNHTWKEISRVDPTEDSEGSVTSQCTICKQTNTKTLNKLPKTNSNEEPKKVENNPVITPIEDIQSEIVTQPTGEQDENIEGEN